MYTHTAHLLSGNLLAHAITAALLPVLSRIVAPEEYGIFGVVVSIASILLPIVSARYEWAIPLPSAEAQSARLIQLSLGILIASVGLLAGLLLLGRELLPDAVSGLGPLIFAAPCVCLVLGLVQIIVAYTVRLREFKRFSQARVAHSILVGGLQVMLASWFGGALALVTGFVAGQALAYGFLLRSMLSRARRALRAQPDSPSIQSTAQQYRRFPLISAPSSLINALGVETPTILLAILSGPEIAGQFALASRVVAIPRSLVVSSLGQAFFAQAAQLVRTDPVRLRRLYRTTVLRLALVGAVTSLAFVSAIWVFPVLFGDQWRAAGQIAALLGVPIFGQIAFGSVSCLEYQNRQDLNLFWNLGRLLIAAVSIAVPLLLGAEPIVTIAIFCVASFLWQPVMYLANEISHRQAIKKHEAAR